MLSTSQQAVIGFTAVLFTFVVLPRMFGVGIGTGGATKDTRYHHDAARFNRKGGPGPGAVRGQPVGLNAPGSAQTLENVQHMKMMMEQEMKSEKLKPNSNKGYVFTLMPLYAVGVGVFAAYKFLKIKSADNSSSQDQNKSKVMKGAKRSAEAENQLNELEQRLAQTERMLNSILTQLDPLTNCVKTVAQEQKNEIMSQLQTIRLLMKKRGMDCPPANTQDSSCDRNLDDLIQSLAAHETTLASEAAQRGEGQDRAARDTEESQPAGDDEEHHKHNEDETTDAEKTEGQTLEEEAPHEPPLDSPHEVNVAGRTLHSTALGKTREQRKDEEQEEVWHEDPEEVLEETSSYEADIEDIGALQPHGGAEEQQQPCGLRRRNRPE